MKTNNIKTTLFASLIVALILPFSGMNYAVAEMPDNVRDKTQEMINHQKNLDQKVEQYQAHMERFIALKEQIASAEKSNQSADSLKDQLDIENAQWAIIAAEHKAASSIPEDRLQKMMEQQDEFVSKALNSDLKNYITGAGIDLSTKEIQVGLDVATITAENKNQVIDSIAKLMPSDTPWHVVDSQRASLDSCTSEKYCDPLLGGNTIKTAIANACSNGFKATLGGIWGFVTAGHCVDNQVGTDVDDFQDDKLGVVHVEEMYYGTDCDCAFIKAGITETDNKTLLTTTSSVTVASYTTAAGQSGDFIYKSGQTNTGLTYGVVNGINQVNWGLSPPFYVSGLVKSTASNVGGDSGGSVMGGTNSDSLYGIIQGHAGSSYYHTPTDKIVSKLGVAPTM